MAASPHVLESSNNAEDGQYVGTHITFETTASAVTNYTVADAELLSALEVESASDAEERGLIGTGIALESATSVDAAPISLSASTETEATIESDSGATMQAYDSQRGHLMVRAADDGSLISANLSADTEAEQADERRVVLTKDDGTQGTFIVLGEGEVTVNERGNVTANLKDGSSLVYQQYDGERSDDDADRESLIADGTAAAEVFVTNSADGSAEAAADIVQYADDTTVDVTTYSENRIEMTAERTESDGRIIITSIADSVFESADDIEVMVDGNAAAQVDSTSELVAATENGDQSAYAIRSTSTAEASTDVIVAVNHFSEREVTMQSASADDTTDADDTADETDEEADPLPGFGVLIAIVGVLGAGLFTARRMN